MLAAITWRGVRSIGQQPFPMTGNDLDLAEHAIRTASAVRVIVDRLGAAAAEAGLTGDQPALAARTVVY